MSGTVLVTGSAGFIGRALVHHLKASANRRIVEADVAGGVDLSQRGWTRCLPGEGVEVVVHLAQSLRYRDFPEGADDMFRVNVAATFDLADWARTHGVRRFILASSGNIYSPPDKPKRLAETDECLPTTMYAATKLGAEHLLRPYASFFEIVACRLFAVYGPGQGNMLIARMIEKVRNGEEIVLGRGEGIHLTPLFVEDCVAILAKLLDAPLEEGWTAFNLAGDEALTLAQIVEAIARQLGREPVIRTTDEPPRHLCGDNTRIKRVYDRFSPFAVGLKKTLG